ncbi:hypothetical protein GCM10008983_28180 [Lentibacillus halophilus]|uniref:Uncharacterized protein n=1 Tax=Lentibacillus halophilus TaxID=295065 RepID=A0ABP3JC06_9BACI
MFMQVLLWIVLILCWLSLFFIKKTAIKRYMPVTIFTALIITIIFEVAYTYGWWTIHKYITPWGYITHPTIAYGYFPVATLWVFYLTSHKFWIYFLTNVVINVLWVLFGFDLIVKYPGVATMKNLGYWQWFFITITISLIVYGYHRWQEGAFRTPKRN